jgi:hypothetical protein
MIIRACIGRLRPEVLLLGLMLALVPLPARGYVLMGEHVLDRMVSALGGAGTLEASQTLTLHAASSLPTPLTLRETVRIRAPYDFRSDASNDRHERRILFAGDAALMAVDGLLAAEPPPRYTRYHDVFVLKPRRALTEYLGSLGIDVAVSSLGRWEDTYCYVVGARYPDEDAPQLWVAKDTFLPCRLLLPSAGVPSGSGPVEIRYRNWTFVEGAAYPMHVVMLENHKIMQEIRVDRVTVNPSFQGAPFDVGAFRREWAGPAGSEDQPRRLLPTTSPASE